MATREDWEALTKIVHCLVTFRDGDLAKILPT